MSKLEVEFEITGLKFRVSGEKEAVPAALASLHRQVANLAQSVASVTTGFGGTSVSPNLEPSMLEPSRVVLTGDQPTQKRTRKRGARNGVAGAIELRHDPEKYGLPKQEWNTATKAMWLLYVLGESGGAGEVGAPALAATFNRYFKEAGGIRRGNVTRDLGNAKGKDRFVNNDSTKEPEVWFLLNAGKEHVQQLIAGLNNAELPVAK